MSRNPQPNESPSTVTTATDIAGTERCPECRAFLHSGALGCPNCGADL